MFNKADFGHNRLNVRYKQCLRGRMYQAEYREKHREGLRDKQKEYHDGNKEELNKKKM